MKKLFVSAVALSAFIMPAMAADLYAPAEPMPAPIPFSWNGFYIGGNVGWGFAETNWKLREFDGADDCEFCGDSVSHNLDGFLGGGQMGFNWDNGSGFVWGGEVEFTFGGGSDTGWYDDDYDAKSEVNWLMTVGPKVGMAADRTLFYVEGGLAVADLDYKFDSNIEIDGRKSGDTRTGWFIGAGAEYAFDNNWSAKLEYNYVDFSSNSLNITGETFDAKFKVENDMHVIKGGINYRF